MSWLARSLANSLRLDDDGKPDTSNAVASTQSSPPKRQQGHQREEGEHRQEGDEHDRSDAQGRGVKEDLSELKDTLTRQLWGVASFLAPPPSQPSTPSRSHVDRSVSEWDRLAPPDPSVSDEGSHAEASDVAGISGFRGDFSEIGGRFRSGFSNLSNHRAVSELSKMASSFLPIGPEEDRESLEEYDFRDIVGITDEVLTFATNIAMHPETWLDFPLEEEEDIDDFDMSDAQEEHAWAVEHLLPRLAALRIELCPVHMSEGYFWKVYFVLLHSRLNKHDAELLSTPQVMAARASWMQELQKRTKPDRDWYVRSTSYSKECSNVVQENLVPSSSNDALFEEIPLRTLASEPTFSYSTTTYAETEKHPVVSPEVEIIDKSVIEEKPAPWAKDNNFMAGPYSKVIFDTYKDDEDDEWPEEENLELGPYSRTTIPVGNEEDVSFSDLEGDDDLAGPIKSKIVELH